MKTLERLVLVHLRPLMKEHLDLRQFAYQANMGVDEATIHVTCLLHTAHSHLDKASCTVKIVFSLFQCF